jgi:hypothetical protein
MFSFLFISFYVNILGPPSLCYEYEDMQLLLAEDCVGEEESREKIKRFKDEEVKMKLHFADIIHRHT